MMTILSLDWAMSTKISYDDLTFFRLFPLMVRPTNKHLVSKGVYPNLKRIVLGYYHIE